MGHVAFHGFTDPCRPMSDPCRGHGFCNAFQGLIFHRPIRPMNHAKDCLGTVEHGRTGARGNSGAIYRKVWVGWVGMGRHFIQVIDKASLCYALSWVGKGSQAPSHHGTRRIMQPVASWLLWVLPMGDRPRRALTAEERALQKFSKWDNHADLS